MLKRKDIIVSINNNINNKKSAQAPLSKNLPTTPTSTVIAPTPQKILIAELNASLFLQILRFTEKFYFQAIANNDFSFNKKANSDFWDQLLQPLEYSMEQALIYLSEQSIFPKNLDKKQENTLIANELKRLNENCRDLMNRIYLMIHLSELCAQYDCNFIRNFAQKYHPFYHAFGAQCIGVVFNWGLNLHMNPPAQTGKPSPQCSRYLEFTSELLAQKAFPQEFLALDTMLGEPCLNENTVSFQNGRRTLLKIAGPANSRVFQFDGRRMMAEALNLFQEKEEDNRDNGDNIDKQSKHPLEKLKQKQKVIVLEATLLEKNVKEECHMVGLAKINLSHKSVYRFIDSEVGEFEASCPKALGEWLEGYFQRTKYSKQYTSFTLRIIDSALEKLALEAQSKKKLDQSSHQSDTTNTKPPKPPKPPTAPSKEPLKSTKPLRFSSAKAMQGYGQRQEQEQEQEQGQRKHQR